MALVVKNLPANAGDIRAEGLIPGSGRFPGAGNGNPLQYSSLENPTERGAWQATVHRVAESKTRLKRLSTHSGTNLCAQEIFFAAFRTFSCPVQASLVMLHGLSNSGARASLPHGMWDLSSLGRDLTRVPCNKG